MVCRENASALVRSNGVFVADGGSFIKTPETYPFLKFYHYNAVLLGKGTNIFRKVK